MIGTIVIMIKYGFPIRKLKNLLFGDEGRFLYRYGHHSVLVARMKRRSQLVCTTVHVLALYGVQFGHVEVDCSV